MPKYKTLVLEEEEVKVVEKALEQFIEGGNSTNEENATAAAIQEKLDAED